MENFAISGKRVVKLVCISADNNNKFYNFFEQGDGTFKVNYGRIKGTSQTHSYPMKDWDKMYREKTSLKKGYKDVTHLFIDKGMTGATGSSSPILPILNSTIKSFMDKIQSYANKSVQSNYSVSKDDVTVEQINFAQSLLTKVSTSADSLTLKEINGILLELYGAIPRKMVNVRDHLVKEIDKSRETLEWISKLIEEEQKILDVMQGQVQLNVVEDESPSENTDLLKMMGIEMEEVSSDDIKMIKNLLGPNANQFMSAFKVTNLKTQTEFDLNLSRAKNKECKLFWHGSRNENWFNIMQSGLLIRPSCAVHTGSMFGSGVYFANKAQKSIGYTSLSGSYWSKGSSSVAYLAIYDVQLGNQKHIYRHDSSCSRMTKSTLDKEGFDSVFAHSGHDLRNDEFIIYDKNQCTIKYIVEIKR